MVFSLGVGVHRSAPLIRLATRTSRGSVSAGCGDTRSDLYGRFATGKCFDHNSSEDQAGGEGPPPLVFMPTIGHCVALTVGTASAGNPFASIRKGRPQTWRLWGRSSSPVGQVSS